MLLSSLPNPLHGSAAVVHDPVSDLAGGSAGGLVHGHVGGHVDGHGNHRRCVVGMRYAVLATSDRTAVNVIVSGVLKKMVVVTDGGEYPDEWVIETENDAWYPDETQLEI